MLKRSILVISVAFLVYFSFVPISGNEVPRIAVDFQSLDELNQFLAQDDTDHHVYLIANSQGQIILNRQCVQVAIQLRDRALERGKYLSLQVLNYTEPTSHMINMAVIGKYIYFIDPQTDRVWLNSYRGDR